MERNVPEPVRGRDLVGNRVMHLPLIGIISRVASAVVYVWDTFTDTNGTLLSSHTPDTDSEGGGWQGNDVDIQSNEAAPVGSGARICMIDAGVSDCIITAGLTIGASGAIHGFGFRYIDGSNLWALTIKKSTTTLDLVERNGGTNTVRDSDSSAPTGDLDMTVTLDGTSIEGDYGGTQVSYTSSFQETETYHGLYGTNASNKWDDFEIKEL